MASTTSTSRNIFSHFWRELSMEEDKTAASKLPPELWKEILASLPVSDLLRFRCVSKTWCSIIDDPSFIHMHLSTVNSDKRFFVFWENYLTGFLESDLRIRGRCSDDEFKSYAEIMSMKYSLPLMAFELLGYVHGLMLFTAYIVDSRVSSDPCRKVYLDLYLFNPSIRKFLMLPPLPSHPGHRASIIFGFDTLGNDHKVIGVQFPGFIVVYELRTRSWRVNTRSSIRIQDKGSIGKGVYANGVMRWIYYDDNTVTSKPRNYTELVSFDFASEEFSYSKLPGDNRVEDDHELLTFPFVFGDSYAILDVSCRNTSIWVLKKCNGNRRYSWSKWYKKGSDLAIFGFFEEHKDEISHVLYVETIRKFLLAVNAKVIVYDMETRTMESFISKCFCVMEPYVESLILCQGIGSTFFNTTFTRT